MKYAIALIVAGLVLLIYGSARAEWQVHEWTGKDWQPARTLRGHEAKLNAEESACLVDLVNLMMFRPDGTRLQCRQTPRPAPAPSR